jgi:hypothetical protein
LQDAHGILKKADTGFIQPGEGIAGFETPSRRHGRSISQFEIDVLCLLFCDESDFPMLLKQSGDVFVDEPVLKY